MSLEQLLGPTGALFAFAVAAGVLWREHIRADVDDRKERDEWKALAVASEADNRRLADLVERALDRLRP